MDAQVKLLRVLQEGELERVGGTQTIKVNVRIIAASNKDLKQAVDKGLFRTDLYYRLNVFAINVPPLKDRKTDLPLLINSFAQKAFKNMGKSYQGLHMQSLKWASHYNWPGNIRELQNWVEHSAILHQTGLFHLIPMQHNDHNHMPDKIKQGKQV